MKKLFHGLIICCLAIFFVGCSNGNSCATQSLSQKINVNLDPVNGSVTNGESNVSLMPIFVLKFSVPMNPSTINAQTIILSDESSGLLSRQLNSKQQQATIQIGNISSNLEHTQFTFSPTESLVSSTKYYLILTSSIKSAQGTPISESSFNFTTGDYVVPMVAIISPSNGAQNVSLSTTVQLQFSESVVNIESNLSLHQGSTTGTTVPTSFSYIGNNSYILTPQTHLSPATTYYVVAESGITDLSGNHLVQTTFNFSTIVNSRNSISQVVSAAQYACGIKQGVGYCWGKNSSGELGNGTTSDSNVPVKITQGGSSAIPENALLVYIAAGSAYDAAGATCAIDSAGEAYCWGDGEAGNFGNGQFNITSPYPLQVAKGGSSEIPVDAILTKIGTSNNSTCALDSNGNAYCWGDNTQGQLGVGNTDNSAYPKKIATGGSSAIPNGDKLVDISVGSLYTCAVDENGKGFCWGWNTEGQCGSGDFTDSYYPVAIATNPSNASSQLSASAILKQISASANTPCPTNQINTCAIDTNGSGYCWGNNRSGQLGINDLAIYNSPVPLAVLAGVSPSAIPQNAKFSKIAAGSGVTCSIADGKGYCWGYNSNGELGDGTTTDSAFPVSISTSGAITASTILADISVGDYGSSQIVDNGLGCAVDILNNFYCWGSNDSGQLGNGTNMPSLVPVRVNLP